MHGIKAFNVVLKGFKQSQHIGMIQFAHQRDFKSSIRSGNDAMCNDAVIGWQGNNDGEIPYWESVRILAAELLEKWKLFLLVNVCFMWQGLNWFGKSLRFPAVLAKHRDTYGATPSVQEHPHLTSQIPHSSGISF